MKWIGGVILMIVTLVLIIMAVFMFPWFNTKTKYNVDVINENNPEYWTDNLDGVERDWDESTYYLQHYELKSSRALTWSNSSTSESTSSGSINYNSAPSAGGWDGSYQELVDADYPVPGFLPGGEEQLAVYNFTYYMLLFAMILSIISIILIFVAGLEKINVTIPKILVVVTAILVVFGPIYFALALPASIEADNDNYKSVIDPMNLNTNATYSRPAEAGGIWGKANERDEDSRLITATTDFAPAFGWWFSIIAIFTTIITIGFIGSPKDISEPSSEERRIRQKYHELDDRSGGEGIYSYDRDSGYGYGEDYRDGYSEREAYYDDYYSPPQRSARGRSRAPQQSYDYGRPAPRPPRRRARYPPADYEPRRRRPPQRPRY